ncbi:MAG TPA: tetratricopeptide repeat protein [Anaeromyxobacteraceae bacterium]|nr:tetratricopeptide repeat protein [Anaeromyxobacteraceae bacterium]
MRRTLAGERHLSVLALVATACATGSPEVKGADAAGADLLAVSRAMARVDLGAPPGGEAAPAEPAVVARYLELYAAPRDETTWGAFRALADKNADAPWGSLGMARVYVAWGTLDQADAEIGRARAIDPANWIALIIRAAAEDRAGLVADARVDYEEILKLDPESPAARLGLARILFASGDVEGANREAERSLAALPDQTAALALLGRCAAALGRQAEAIDYLSRAAAASPREAALRAELARARLETGDANGAVADWRAALKLEESLAYLRGLEAAASRAEDLDAEIQAAAGIARLEPGPAENWRRLATLRLEVRDEEGAEGALRRVIERDPQDAQSRLELGRILLARGEPLLAMEQFRAAGDVARAERGALERRLQVFPVAAAEPPRIQRVVAERLGRLIRQDASPTASGVLVLRVTVGPGGEASEVAFVEDTVNSEWVRASAYWNLKNATYPNKAGRLTLRFKIGPSKVVQAAGR